MNWVIIFLLAVFALMVGFMQAGRFETTEGIEVDWETYFNEQMQVIDSLYLETKKFHTEWELLHYDGSGVNEGDWIKVRRDTTNN